MLLQFRVTNAFSFKDEAILDMTAVKDSEHKDYLISFNKTNILPTAAIYGANASGKSNLFRALTSAIMFVRNSQKMQINERIAITPFLMDFDSRNHKSKFDFVFESNGIKYEYGFSTDIYKVYEEYLFEYKSAKPSLIFKRENVNEFSYTTPLKKKLKRYEERNTDNKLFLSTATMWNCEETRNAFLWFKERIDTYNHESVQVTMAEELDSNISEEIKAFAKKFLKAADFNISDYEFSVKPGLPDNIQLPPGISFDETLITKVKRWELKMLHEVEVDGKTQIMELPFAAESDGTQLFFEYCPAVYKALKNGKTIVIDEIDSGLHPLLVQHLVEVFNNKDTNPNGAQLIFNAHDINLLDLDLLRRDQIYFTEKNNTTGESELYSLSDYSPRKTEKIQKGYMIGRYRAIPNIRGLEW